MESRCAAEAAFANWSIEEGPVLDDDIAGGVVREDPDCWL